MLNNYINLINDINSYQVTDIECETTMIQSLKFSICGIDEWINLIRLNLAVIKSRSFDCHR